MSSISDSRHRPTTVNRNRVVQAACLGVISVISYGAAQRSHKLQRRTMYDDYLMITSSRNYTDAGSFIIEL